MADPENPPFASANVGEHLLRGALAIAALVLAGRSFNFGGWYAVAAGAALLAFAFMMFRGCPVCWTVGLFNTCKIASSRESPPAG